MVVGESIELLLVLLTIVIMYVLIFSVERATKHEGPPVGEQQPRAKE